MGRWKQDAQCAVMLTFDVDAETLWLSGDITRLSQPGTISQGTYGARVAVSLILDVLKRHELPATFFIPGWTAENHSRTVLAIHRMGHEIGHHGWIHEHPTKLSLAQEEEVLQKGIAALQEITGKSPAGYRSPAWEFSDHTLDLLASYQFDYSSNMMSHFIPWIHAESDIVELPCSWLLDDAPYFLFGSGRTDRPIQPAANAFAAWKEEFEGIYRYGGLFNLTMHPQIIGRPGRLNMLEELIQHIKRYPEVWFATGSEISTYWRTHGMSDPEIGLSFDL